MFFVKMGFIFTRIEENVYENKNRIEKKNTEQIINEIELWKKIKIDIFVISSKMIYVIKNYNLCDFNKFFCWIQIIIICLN